MSVIHPFNHHALEHGQAVSAISNLVTDLKKTGEISEDNKYDVIDKLDIFNYCLKHYPMAVDTYSSLSALSNLLQTSDNDIIERSIASLHILISRKQPFLDKAFVKNIITFLDVETYSDDIVIQASLLLTNIYSRKRPIDDKDKTLSKIARYEEKANGGVATYIQSIIKSALIYNRHLAKSLKRYDRDRYLSLDFNAGKERKLRSMLK